MREILELHFAKGERIPEEGETVRQQGIMNEYDVKIFFIRAATHHEDGTVTLSVNAIRTIVEATPPINQYWSLSAHEQSKLRR